MDPHAVKAENLLIAWLHLFFHFCQILLWHTPPATPSLLAHLPIYVFYELIYDFLLFLGRTKSDLDSPIDKKGKKSVSFRFGIRYICNSTRCMDCNRSLGTSRCQSIHTWAWFVCHKEALSSWTILRWYLQKILLSIFCCTSEFFKTWLTGANSW